MSGIHWTPQGGSHLTDTGRKVCFERQGGLTRICSVPNYPLPMTTLPTPFPFQVLDQGTLFTADQIWDTDEGEIETCRGAWEFAHVTAVLAPVPSQFPTVDGPTCALVWMGEHLHVRAEFTQVLAAWRRYRQQHKHSPPLHGAPLLRWCAN